MGLVCNNYGTFIVPPSYCEVEDWRDGGGTGSAAQNQNTAPSYEQATATSGVEHRMLRDSEGRFALRLRKHRTEVVVSEMGDEEARVGVLRRTRALDMFHRGELLLFVFLQW